MVLLLIFCKIVFQISWTISSGRPLFYGDKTIPTAQAIEKYNLGICVNTEKELQSLLSDHNYFIKKVSMLQKLESKRFYTQRIPDSRLELFKDFKEHLKYA